MRKNSHLIDTSASVFFIDTVAIVLLDLKVIADFID